MPEMDDGPADGPPGKSLPTVTVVLTRDEAVALLESLKVWAEDIEDGQPSKGWHMHIDNEAGQLMVVIQP